MPNVTEIESDKMSIWNWGSLNLKPEMVLLHTSGDNCDASTVNYHGGFNKGNSRSRISNTIFRMVVWLLCKRQRVVSKSSREFGVNLDLNPMVKLHSLTALYC